MDIERDRLIEIVVSVGAVALMITVMMAIGAAYSTGEALSAEGGKFLVGSIAFFVLLMAAVGYGLALTVSAGRDENEETAAQNRTDETAAADGNGAAAAETGDGVSENDDAAKRT